MLFKKPEIHSIHGPKEGIELQEKEKDKEDKYTQGLREPEKGFPPTLVTATTSVNLHIPVLIDLTVQIQL